MKLATIYEALENELQLLFIQLMDARRLVTELCLLANFQSDTGKGVIVASIPQAQVKLLKN